MYSLETVEMMRKEAKGRKSECIRKCKNVLGLTSFKYAKNAGIFNTLRIGADKRKGREPCKSESYKVLNLAFYPVVSDKRKI